jgi:hypothetical protein
MNPYPTMLDTLTLHAADDLLGPPEPPDEELPILPYVSRVGVLSGGGAGKLVASSLNAYAVADGQRLAGLSLDNDHLAADQVRLPDGRTAALAPDAFLPLGQGHPRNALKQYPLLRDRYEGTQEVPGLLRGISVYESYPVAGSGGGAYPVISMLDLDLDIADVTTRVRQFLGQFKRRRAHVARDFWEAPAPPAVPVAEERLTLLFIAGGCGSCGAAFLRLLPYLTRREAREMHLPEPYQVGIVMGPRLYAGFHPRAKTNWLSTVLELDEMTRKGFRWEFIDGSHIDEATPPFDRVIFADAAPAGPSATDAELARFGMSLGKTLYAAVTSDVFSRLEALALNERTTPYTTMRGVVAAPDLAATASLATAYRAFSRLDSLQAPVEA